MENMEEDRKNLEDLYTYGMRWLELIETEVKAKDQELVHLRQEQATLNEARQQIEALASIIRRPNNG